MDLGWFANRGTTRLQAQAKPLGWLGATFIHGAKLGVDGGRTAI